MKKSIKLSIIVPVYNVEKYIQQCIESILYQKLENFELILVDDGSTDMSGKICDEYKNNSKVKIIHQENKGLSGARNTGIRNSTGEYLMFIDSDDYINEEVKLNMIVNNLKADVTQYKWVYYYENINKYVYFNDLNKKNEKDISNTLFRKIKTGEFSVSACDKFIKRKIIVDNDIFFKEGILSEDMDWSFRLYSKINSLETINENIYIYRQQRKGSITNNFKEKNIKCLFNIIKEWSNFSYDNDILKKAYLNYLAYHYVILLTIINKKNCSKDLKKEIYSYNYLLKYDENYKVKMSNKIFKIMGMYFGIKVMKIYICFKNLGIIKL